MLLQPKIHISMLGNFSISRFLDGEEKKLTEQYATSKRLWLFLQYMAAYHHREVTQEELIRVLWWDEDSVNPANAMKTLLHRARAVLEELGFSDGCPAILYKRGVYQWNRDLQIDLDTEEFEDLCAGEGTPDLDKVLCAIDLYKGEFLQSAPESPWIVSMRMYYHSKYIKLCAETAATFNEQGKHREVIRICKNAINIDPLEEACHMEMMVAMTALGLTQPALQHYHYVAKLFMDQLGIGPSQEMMDLYRRLNQSNIRLELDLEVIQGLLIEPKRIGAFYCEYGVFREMYRLEARRASRTGQENHLLLITLLDSTGACMHAGRCTAAMEEMKTALHRSLRSGDIFARFSPSQYLILLPGAGLENAEMVYRRIQQRYSATLIGKTTSLVHSVRPVEPMLGEE